MTILKIWRIFFIDEDLSLRKRILYVILAAVNSPFQVTITKGVAFSKQWDNGWSAKGAAGEG